MTRVKVVKNKLGAPFCEAEPELLYGQGFSQLADLLRLGSECGIIEKSGSWYAYNGERLGQGRDNAIELLTNTPELAQKLFSVVRAKLMPEEEKQQ